jgi:hypothetical protein
MNQNKTLSIESKSKFLDYVKKRKPVVEKWLSKLIDEVEKRSEQLELQWSQPLPTKDFPISAQIIVRKWNAAPFEILADDFFLYFYEPRFYFDQHGEAGDVPLWAFPKDLENELTKILKGRARGGGMLLYLNSKKKLGRVVNVLDEVIRSSDNTELIWNPKIEDNF